MRNFIRMPLINKIIVRIVLINILIFVPGVSPVHAEGEISGILESQMNSKSVSDFRKNASYYLNDEIEKIFPGIDVDELFNFAVTGQTSENRPESFMERTINGIIKYIFHEVTDNMKLMIQLIVVAVLCTVLKNLQTSFLSESVGETAFYVCFVLIMGMLLNSFRIAVNFCSESVSDMVAFMQSSLPVLITLSATSGNMVTAGTFQPILILISQLTGSLMKSLLLPIILISTVLILVSNLSDRIQVSKLGELVRQVGSWIVGIMLSLFVGVITVQGAVTSSIDGVASKTAKFALSTFVPVAGKYLADAADTVIGCSMIIRNAAGVLSLAVLAAIAIIPLLKVLAMLFIYRIAAVIAEPISDRRIVKSISDIGNALSYLFGITVAVSVMFLLSIAALVNSSNAAVMIR